MTYGGLGPNPFLKYKKPLEDGVAVAERPSVQPEPPKVEPRGIIKPTVPTFEEWSVTKGATPKFLSTLEEWDREKTLKDLQAVYEYEQNLGRWGTLKGGLEKAVVSEPETLWDAAKIFGETLTKLPKQFAATVIQATQGESGASVVNKDWGDRLVLEAQEDINKFITEVSEKYPDKQWLTEIASLSQNLAYSITSMGAGLAVGVPIGLLPVPFARYAAYTAGTAASGYVAYQMTTYQIVLAYLELKNADKIASTGKGLTLDEENKLKQEFSALATKYGLWEAVPEAISNLAFVSLLTAPLTNMLGKNIATRIISKIAGIYGEEILTETITQKGQAAIEFKAGMREEDIDWGTAFKEVFPQTFLLTTVMGGAGQTIVSSANAIKKAKASLKSEAAQKGISEDSPLYSKAEQEIETKLSEAVTPPVTPVTPEVTKAEIMARPPRIDQIGSTTKPVIEKVSDIGGFEQTLSPANRAKAITQMNEKKMIAGKSQTRKEYIENAVTQGAVTGIKEGKPALVFPDGRYIRQSEITKTALDYADYLKAIPKAEVGMPEAGVKVSELSLTGKQIMRDAVTVQLRDKLTTFAKRGFNIENVARDFNGDLLKMGFTEGEAGAIIKDTLADVRKEFPISEAITPPAEVTPTAPVVEPIPEMGKIIPKVAPIKATKEIPQPEPPSGRPRTLVDLNREAKGMRAMTPEQRAAAMDVAKPIAEGELLYKVKPFNEHADNLLQPDSPIKQAMRTTPGWKQVVGLINRAQMERSNPVAMIGITKDIYQEIETGRARIASLSWWNDAEDLFGFKKVKGKWVATKLEPSTLADTKKPYYRTIHDIVEHPENYIFTDAQRTNLKVALDMQAQILRDAQRVGVNAVELTGDYWRRIVTKGPKDKLSFTGISKRISGRKGYTMQRAFEFVDDGAKMGFEYETHPLTTLQDRLEAGIRTISDQEARQAIARLPGVEKPLERLEAKFPQTIEGQKIARRVRDNAKQIYLKDKTVENMTALRQAEADYITAMREVYLKKIEAGQPGYYELRLPNGRVAPMELVEEVNKWIELPELRTKRGSIVNTTNEILQLLRSTLTNLDLAAGYIQGQTLFYRDNPSWWIAQSKAILSLIGDPTAYVKKNFAVMDEGMRMGAISIPTEFMFGKGGIASIPTRIPGIGVVMRACNRAFEWFIVTGQTELYKVTRTGVIRKATGQITPAGVELEQKAVRELVSLGSAIRKELGTESYAILGIKPNQRMAEQLTLFAARFFRANTGIMGQSFTGGRGGAEARKAMGALIAGGLALTFAISYLQDKKPPNVTDPFAPDWLQFRIGKTYFNAFGPFYPYFRTIARASVYTAQMKPDKASNEIKNFLTSKAGLLFRAISIGGEFAFKGKARTWEGEVLPNTPAGWAKGLLGEMAVPISIQEAMEAIPQGRPEAVVGELFGLSGRGSPYNQMDIMFQRATDINPDGLSYRYAEPWQEAEMEKRYPDIAKMLIGRGQGVWADASQMWAETDDKYYTQEEALAGEFTIEEITPDEFRNRYDEIQQARVNEKAGINKVLDLFQDEKKLPDDPNERALAEYYLIYDKATTASGRVNWDLVDTLMATYEALWTQEQKAFVERNTGLREHPPLIQEYIEAKEKLKPYWEIPAGKNQTAQRKAYRLANPDIDAILVKWYGYKPVISTTPKTKTPSGGLGPNPFLR